MSNIPVTRFLVRSLFRRNIYGVLTKRTLQTSTIYNNQPSILGAGEFLNNVLESCNTGSVFAGIGQYYKAKDQDRIVILNFAEDFVSDPSLNIFDTTTLLDCSLKESDVDLLLDNIRGLSKLPVFNGEVDFINTSPWQFGFTLKPFSIFSGDERILLLKDKVLCVSTLGNLDVIDPMTISYVGLWVSEEPYNERKLLLGFNDKASKILINIQREDEHCDLATLTVQTEWMMKAAALLCVNLTKIGNEEVHLRVAPVLQPANNEFVAMRQKVWIDMIQKNTSKDQES